MYFVRYLVYVRPHIIESTISIKMYSQVVSLARASLADDDKIEISIELKMSKKATIKICSINYA